MAVLSAITATLGGSTLGAILAVEAGQDAAVTVALIGAVGGFAGVLVTGIVAVLRDRKPAPDPSRHIPETADALRQEMTQVDDLRAENRELRGELRHERAETDLWQQRAYQCGWRP